MHYSREKYEEGVAATAGTAAVVIVAVTAVVVVLIGGRNGRRGRMLGIFKEIRRCNVQRVWRHRYYKYSQHGIKYASRLDQRTVMVVNVVYSMRLLSPRDGDIKRYVRPALPFVSSCS